MIPAVVVNLSAGAMYAWFAAHATELCDCAVAVAALARVVTRWAPSAKWKRWGAVVAHDADVVEGLTQNYQKKAAP